MIGLIFGDTDFPKEILKKIKRRRFKYLIIDLSKKLNPTKSLALLINLIVAIKWPSLINLHLSILNWFFVNPYSFSFDGCDSFS